MAIPFKTLDDLVENKMDFESFYNRLLVSHSVENKIHKVIRCSLENYFKAKMGYILVLETSLRLKMEVQTPNYLRFEMEMAFI